MVPKTPARQGLGGLHKMEDFGSDFITITDEDGVEYELEILSELDYQGAHYLAVVPAMDSEEEPEELEPPEVSVSFSGLQYTLQTAVRSPAAAVMVAEPVALG